MTQQLDTDLGTQRGIHRRHERSDTFLTWLQAVIGGEPSSKVHEEGDTVVMEKRGSRNKRAPWPFANCGQATPKLYEVQYCTSSPTKELQAGWFSVNTSLGQLL